MTDRRGLPDAALRGTFNPDRLRQARYLAEKTKRELAQGTGVSPAAVGQWEAGIAAPRPDYMQRLADLLDVPVDFFLAGRRYVRLDVGDAHFRSLRSTPAALRAKAIACTEQVWELTHYLEQRVQLPLVDLPGFSGGEVHPGDYAGDPSGAARALRRHWQLDGPIPHLVNVMERHGLIVTYLPFSQAETKKIDAFSTSHLPRPIVVLTPDRSMDVYRHRFTAAHELGHLLLHNNIAPGDPLQEKEADRFAAELLTPSRLIVPELPKRLDLHQLERLGRSWGVSVESLIYRSHEVGTISEPTYRRAFQRLNQLRNLGLFPAESVNAYPGEIPSLLSKAFDVAAREGLTLTDLAAALKIRKTRLQTLLGRNDDRPQLRLVVD
ncbi:Zn-dependent peptidase ImmA (M78 family) [Jatrophihabitans sp. GAS493]|uniref:XRE family transcriptional regulator n=1 Tax=Jatrophihabitans sp. GAS493 TaxID=1907575 RepID=UPI000BB70DCD|nr:XRE family transcriptional regulator [Jatrophihabitans sp. GAS493]SOD72912.1 Zn-dependent peptidase ImmA (M78 family) [Jatrophihabitans sp. GAS493]